MAFDAPPLIQTITRSSTTHSWPTAEQTAAYLFQVSQKKELVRRALAQDCPSASWKVLP